MTRRSIDLLQNLKSLLLQVFAANFPEISMDFSVESTRNLEHGEFATNLAMVVAKRLDMDPKDVALKIIPALHGSCVKEAVYSPPGFINMTLESQVWTDLMSQIDVDYGKSNIGLGEKINIEYVSANPTGPVHIGHVRGSIIGDTLAEMMSAVGYNVIREYYINDAGSQIDTLVDSVSLRCQEALGTDIGAIPTGMYPGAYLIPVAKDLIARFGDSFLDNEKSAEIIKPIVINHMMEGIKRDLAALKVHHDVFSSEKNIVESGLIEEAISELRKRDLIYQAFLEEPKKTAKSWQRREQILFRSSLASDDNSDRALTKADGSWSYFAADIGYNYSKYKRGFKKIALILGRDHIGYAKRLQSAINALTDGKMEITIIFYHLVNLMNGDEVVKMSKRMGNFLTAQDVIEIIGSDVTRFVMLSRSNDMILDFDLEKARESSKDNPVFYIQYAHARAHSIMRRAPNLSGKIDMSLLNTEGERTIMRMLAEWPSQLRVAVQKYEPHRIAFYLQNLAKTFHAFWNVGKTNDEARFIVQDNPDLTASRLALTRAVARVIANGLIILKIDPMEEM